MKRIGVGVGVTESRVSQLPARAVQRLRKALGADGDAAEPISPPILSFQPTMRRLRMAKADLPHQPGVVLQYRTAAPPQDTASTPRRQTTIRPQPAVAAAR